jgi:thymidylate synthase
LNFKNINEAQLSLLKLISQNGDTVETRGFKTLELSPVMFSISDPLARITTIKNRDWNFAAAVGELVWHLSGSNDLSFISSYLKEWKNYSDDGRVINGSCYGHKIFKKNSNGESQWDKLIELLRKDPGSRRAVLDLYDEKESLSNSLLDVPCTCTLQFFIRNKQINLVAYMRSNDIIWGLPYDFFFFSFLQELLSVTLGLELGIYTHIAGSLHLYDYHFSMANAMINGNGYEKCSMGKIPSIDSVENFVSIENKIRNNKLTLKEINDVDLEEYWVDLLKVLLYYNEKKKGHTKEQLKELKSLTSYSCLL